MKEHSVISRYDSSISLKMKLYKKGLLNQFFSLTILEELFKLSYSSLLVFKSSINRAKIVNKIDKTSIKKSRPRFTIAFLEL